MDIEKEIEKLQADLREADQQIAQLVAVRERIIGALSFAQRIKAEAGVSAAVPETAPAEVA
jgi:hypothetical protein